MQHMHRKQHVFLALFAFFVSISLVACGGSSTASSAPTKTQITPKPSRIIDRDNGYLYYTTPQGIYQIHADTGHPGWKTPQGKAQVALSEDQQTLYISSENTSGQPALTALDSSTRQQKWSTPFDQITTFLVHGNSIYVASLGTLYRVDATTGKATWKTDPANSLGGGHAFIEATDSLVYFTYTYSVNAYDATTGKLVWQQKTETSTEQTSGLKLVGNILVDITIAPGVEGHIEGLNPQTGRKIWSDGVYAVTDTIDVSKHLVYLLYNGGDDSPFTSQSGLAAIKTDDGAGGVAWSNQFHADNQTLAVFSTTNQGQPTAYIASQSASDNTPQVVAYSLQNGHSLWTSNATAPSSGINTTGNSTAKVTVIQPGAGSDTNTYAVLDDGTVYAFDPQGKLVWNKQFYAINIISYASTSSTTPALYILGTDPSTDQASNFNLSVGASKYKVTSTNPNSGAGLWQWSIPASYPPNEIYASDLYALVSDK
ncbi:Pyrrolo-quinoline quinone [Ktedonobacter racemifer DSM 44963]|uniref:Pyrrolo-quinoline quinone n=2 Tax=Ktedonobacter racemifer TaxID=363277 RepID=D6TKC0_KTERA|nr:Pyrrolo-quinoline quinone [Ktedonobacter racemifer DSM 44963]